jgi:hypothetical protein
MAVLAGFEGGTLQVWNCFTVAAAEPAQNEEPKSLAQLISAACIERQLKFDEVTLAVDCGMFTQHSVHSEFTSDRQIAQTIRFDAEESLATDASKLAIAFHVTSSDESGSNVSVFSAQRTVMTDILADLQNNKLEPVAMEPDAVCLVRFIQYAFAPEEGTHPLYAMLGQGYGYFIAAGKTRSDWPIRTFLIGPNQNRNSLLASQIPMTVATLNVSEPVDSLRLLDSTNTVDIQKAARVSGLEAQQTDMGPMLGSVAAGMTETPDAVDFAIACGAALGHFEKSRVDFRQDFMPYQGRKILLENTLKMLSIAVTVMLLAVGLYFQLRLFKSTSYMGMLHKNMRNEYAAVFGKMPAASEGDKAMLDRLKRELIRIQKVKSGQLSTGGETSVSALLTYVLETLNNVPSDVHLDIDFITVGTKSIIIAGNTASRQNTIALFNAIDAHEHLRTSQNTYETKNGRDEFRVTVLPKEGPGPKK